MTRYTRRFHPQDAQACCDIINRCIAAMDEFPPDARDFIIARNVPGNLSADLAKCYTLVIEENGCIMAVGALSGNEIKRVYVDPEHRNRGRGTILYGELEAQAARLGLDRVVLESAPSSVSFWSNQGFISVESADVQIGDTTVTVIKMQKELSPTQREETRKPDLTIMQGVFTIHRFPPNHFVPVAVFTAPFFTISKTSDELSIVCPADTIIGAVVSDSGWACIKVLGPLDFALTGILADISAVLAQAEISIFALSTYDTDYILVKSHRLADAIHTLDQAGYRID